MHRIVPDLIIENYRSGQRQGSFRAVGMFLDLSGFSRLTDALTKEGQHGAETLMGVMHNIFDPLVTSIFKQGGKIVGFAGDGIMALFPVETDERAAALNALASAWRIQQSMAAHRSEQTTYGKFSVYAKIGLALGEVKWSILDARDKQKAIYYFSGPAVEGSADGEHLARPGDTILSASLYHVLQADIAAEPIASFHRLTEIRGDLPGPRPIHLPAVDVSIARVFVPETILTRDERGEFRQAVNLFMRFPELPDEELQEFVYKLFDLQEQYGGLLTRIDFGDKGCNMLLLWGAPVAYENDIGRALNFLQDLKARVNFPITAGVTYYIAHAGFLGGAMSEYYTCYGWGVNLASRFMMSAPIGSVWTDERVARRVKNRFDFEYQGAQKFKGFDTEQKVFLLLGRKPRVEFPHQAEFVGREKELTRLTEFLQPLWQGKNAGRVFVVGDAGIGKSRLIYELKAAPALEECRALWAFCHSDQVLRHSFNPFRYWLFNYFNFAFDMDDLARKRAFHQTLDDLLAHIPAGEIASDLERTRSVLGALLDLYWPDSFYETLDAEGRYNNTLLALISLFKAESLRQPLALIIEDAQFMDADSAVFLPRLQRALREFPVAFIISARRTGCEAILSDALENELLELDALPRQAIANLAEIYLGGAASPELTRFLHERSEGNPYFAEQILVYLQEERFLEMGAQGWQTAHSLFDSSLPADIRALLMARLDQLHESVRDAIQTASVLGREFEVQVLAAMMGDAVALDGALEQAEQAEILIPVGRQRYAFRHGLLRDAAYSMQMQARRRELHALTVDTLERLYAAELEYHYGELAYHAEHANLVKKALVYLPLAGRRSSSLYQNTQAMDYFSRALSLLPEHDQSARFDLLFERMEVFKRVGNRKAQWEDIEAMERIAGHLNDQELLVKTLVQQSGFYFSTGEFARSVTAAEKAIALVADADFSLKLTAYSYLASSLARLGQLDEGMARAQEGLRLARIHTARRNEAELLSIIGLIFIEKNDLPKAMEHLQYSIKIAHEIQDLAGEISALNNLGNVSALLGDYSLARDCYERAYAGVRSRGHRYGEGLMLNNLGWIAGIQGDFESACAYQQQALVVAREIGNPYQEAFNLINLSAVLGVQGDAAAALESARLANDLCLKIGERSGRAWALLNMGHAYLLSEELYNAQTAYEQCLEIRKELRQPTLAAEARAGLLQIALYKDNQPLALEHLNAILATMECDCEFSGVDDPLRIYYVCLQALDKMNDRRASAVLAAGKKILEERLAKIKDETARRMYVESIPWRRALQMADNPAPALQKDATDSAK